MSKAYIVLENGRIFEGESFGAEAIGRGELVFNTGVAGYIETLSDPCLLGQIVVFTFPQIGNYGVNSEDMESPQCRAGGVIVREWCRLPSNFRSEETVDRYLKRCGVPGVCGVDTRELTRVIREHGEMPALILRERPQAPVNGLFDDFRFERGILPAAPGEKRMFCPEGGTRFKTALIDYGAKKRILSELLSRSCEVAVFPGDTPAEDILKTSPDGVVLSNGPGDPREHPYRVGQIELLFGKLPMLGVGLGHQLMALAAGGSALRLKYGHRGANHPVRETQTGRIYISSQNHGFAVSSEGLAEIGAKISYTNVNDGSCEGLVYPEKQALSHEFYPEAGTGTPEFSFDRFSAMMEGF